MLKVQALNGHLIFSLKIVVLQYEEYDKEFYRVNNILYCLGVRHKISSSILFCQSHQNNFQNLQFYLKIQ